MDQNGKARQPVPNIRSTPGYIIFLDTPLGQGATSKVYGGRHKKSGKRVACKVPNVATFFRPGTDMERESQVLLRLRHKNIVCLEAIEKDQISKENILVMELCTAGSLFDVLEKPEHSCGLPEKDFIQVLTDMTCGMKYLRDHDVVHRDVKPGNIMCFKDEHGQTIYKLADFGAARQLTDDENFTSLHGTEEYLHPKVFERAVLRRAAGSSFDARIDLWSIGATLYHLATGQLPFRPQGGRKNSQMMFHLTTKKPPGVISGVQTGPGNTDISWSRELPDACRISKGLKMLLTPLLARLLEYNTSRVWSFTEFFEASQGITNKLVLDLFWTCEASYLKLYCNSTDTFAEFQEHIASQTKLSSNQQTIFLNGEKFKPDGSLSIFQYPDTTTDNPMILCNKELIQVPHQITPPYIATMPVLKPRFSTQHDYPIAKGALATGHILQLRQSSIHRMHRHFDQYVTTLHSGLKLDTLSLQVYHKKLQGSLVTISMKIRHAERVLNMCRNPQEDQSAGITHQFNYKLEEYSHQHMQYEMQSNEIGEMLDKVHLEIHMNKDQETTWKYSQGCSVQDEKCTTELMHLTNEIEDIYTRFSRDKKTGKLSYNEEQIHKMEKLNLGELMKKAMNCIAQCETRWREQHDKLMICHNKAYSQRQQLMNVDCHLVTLIEQCESLESNVSDLHSKCWQLVESKPRSPTIDQNPVPCHSPKEILLSASTQTSLPRESNEYQTIGSLLHQPYQESKASQPIMMAKPSHTHRSPASAPVLSSPSVYQYIYPDNYRTAVTSPPCGICHHHVPRTNSSPPVLVARGITKYAAPDPPSELYGVEPSPGAIGGLQDPRPPAEGSRMIRVSKELKKKVMDYRKQYNTTDQIQRDLDEIMKSEHYGESLEAPKMPSFDEDSSLLDTLTEGVDDEANDSILEGLDIKRPPASYQSSTE